MYNSFEIEQTIPVSQSNAYIKLTQQAKEGRMHNLCNRPSFVISLASILPLALISRQATHFYPLYTYFLHYYHIKIYFLLSFHRAEGKVKAASNYACKTSKIMT